MRNSHYTVLSQFLMAGAETTISPCVGMPLELILQHLLSQNKNRTVLSMQVIRHVGIPHDADLMPGLLR